MAQRREPSFDEQLLVRSTGRTKQALDRLVADLRGSGKLRFKGRKVTKEAVLNAVLLWLEGMDLEVIEGGLGRQMGRLEAILKGEPDPGPGPETGGGPARPVRNVEVRTEASRQPKRDHEGPEVAHIP